MEAGKRTGCKTRATGPGPSSSGDSDSGEEALQRQVQQQQQQQQMDDDQLLLDAGIFVEGMEDDQKRMILDALRQSLPAPTEPELSTSEETLVVSEDSSNSLLNERGDLYSTQLPRRKRAGPLDRDPAVSRKRAGPLDRDPAVSRKRAGPLDRDPAVSRKRAGPLDRDPAVSRKRAGPLDRDPAVSRKRAGPLDRDPAVSRKRAGPLDRDPAVSRKRAGPLDRDPAVSRKRAGPLDRDPAVSRLKRPRRTPAAPLALRPGSKVPSKKRGDPQRAMKTLPPGLEVRESGIPDAGLGVFATQFFPTGSRFGPYQGRRATDPDIAHSSGYCWQEGAEEVIACPLCSQLFRASVIEAHASDCSLLDTEDAPPQQALPSSTIALPTASEWKRRPLRSMFDREEFVCPLCQARLGGSRALRRQGLWCTCCWLWCHTVLGPM